MPQDKDSGCQYHPSCFTCPFVMCILDYPGGPNVYFEHKELQDLMDSGMSKLEAARKLGITRDAVWRRRTKAEKALGIK